MHHPPFFAILAEAITQGSACPGRATREYAHHLWVTPSVEGPSVLKYRIPLQKHQVKLNERLMKSTSCGDEKGKGTRANGKG